jgi:hypothetical protein
MHGVKRFWAVLGLFRFPAGKLSSKPAILPPYES